MLNALAAYHAPEEGNISRIFFSHSYTPVKQTYYDAEKYSVSPSSLLRVAERGEERLVTVPGSQDLCQILQDVGDDVYQQYRLTRQGSDFDSQSAFHINVSLHASTENSQIIQYPTFYEGSCTSIRDICS